MARKVAKKARAGKARARAVVRRETKTRTARLKAARTRAAEADALDVLIDATARARNIPLAPEWKPAVKANLRVIFRFADNVASFRLPDEAEPAPVFRA